MKNIIFYIFLLFSATVFSQNYFYALDEAPITDTENPTTPLNLVASNITLHTADLSWTASADNIAVVGYRIYNNGSFLVSVGNFTNYTISGLTESADYNLTVRALDTSNNESTDSNIESFTTNSSADVIAPSAPLNLVASNITVNTADLSWTASTDNIAVAGYRIYSNGSFLVSVGNTTNYTIAGLTESAVYNLTVRALDTSNNESTDSNIESFTTNSSADVIAPTAPINLVASNITENTADLSWTASTDNVAVASYRIYNNGSFLVSVGNITNYTIAGLTESADYNLTVRALDTSNNLSADSNNQTFTTSASVTFDTIAPTAPTNLIASNIGETTADLSWTTATDNTAVVGYNIYNNLSLIYSIGNVTSYSLTGLTENTNYNITVRAFDAAGNESSDSNAEIFITNSSADVIAPTAPLNLVASNIEATSADLSWTAATDNLAVLGYNIYDNGILLTSVGNITSYTLTGLTGSTNYNMTIRAFDTAGNESSASNIESFTTNPSADIIAPTAPINAVVTNITETTATYTWDPATDNVGVTNYKVFTNAVDSGFLGNVTSYEATGLTPNSNYDFVVKAYDTAGNESTDSNLISFTTLTSTTTDVIAPTSPTNLVASNVTENTIDLTWTASTDNVGVVNYAIYNNDVFVTNTGNVISYQLTGLAAETQYNLTVRAIDAATNESINSNTVIVTTVASQFTSTRFLMMGDSMSYTAYFFEDQIESQIKSSFPNETVEVLMMASPGESIDSYATGNTPNVDSYLATVSDIPTVDTYCVVMLGTNDARIELYEDLTQTEIDTKIANLNYIVDAIEAKGFTPILIDAPFSNFQPSTAFPSALGPAYDDESKGAKPYNDNIIIPTILSRTPNYAFTDGQSFMQPYVLFYNEHPDITDDGVHPATYSYLKNSFVDRLVNYIFTGQAPTKILKNGSLPNDSTCQQEAYFDAYYVTSSEATNLQSLLNTYGSVRLGAGDFSAAGNITIGSNQSLYGFPSQYGTELGMGEITIAAGSNNVIIKDFDPQAIIFEAGAEISNVTIDHISKSKIEGTSFRLRDSKIINIHNVKTDFDNSASGYTRNVKFIRAFAQASPDHVTWLGNDAESSYGNIELSRNFLSSNTDTSNYDNLESHTLLGTDSEFWDAQGVSIRGPYYFRDCGQVNIFNSFGWSSPAQAPEFDIEADLVWMQRRGVGSNQTPVFRTGTDVIYVEGGRNAPNYEGNNFYLEAHHSDNDIIFNGSNLSTEITGADATALSNMIYKPKYTPISKPSFKNLCSPTGPNWSTDRVGQIDQSAFIQNLIDTNGVAELDEGIYYISQPLLVENGEGVIGKGTGKTAIVGITDDFPLIKVNTTVTSASKVTNQNHIINHITLQGGSIGYYVKPNFSGFNVYMITNNTINDVVFRNQTDAGIRFEDIHGYDNNFFNNVSFVDCTNGMLQIPDTVENADDHDVAYIDKTVFYNCQFINCGTALNLATIRANNLNAWIDCNFDGNDIAFNTTQSNALYVANSVFKNGKGSAVMTGNARMSLYGCDFTNNSVSSLFGGKRGIYAEGCNFNDSGVNFFNGGYEKDLYLWNSNVASTITLSDIDKGLFINNNVNGNSTLTKPMVEVIKGTPLTILDGTVDVYPQLLVKQ